MKNLKFLLLVLFVGCLFILPSSVNAASMLSSLEVEGIGGLNLSKRNWNLSLATSYDYANVIATPSDSSVTVEGAGKISLVFTATTKNK